MADDMPVLLIAVPFEATNDKLKSLQSKFPNLQVKVIQLTLWPPLEEIQQKISKELWKMTTYLFTFMAFPDSVKDVPNLRFIQLASAGSNQVHARDIWQDPKIALATSTGIHGPQIAEWVILTGLAHSRQLEYWKDLQRQRTWKAPNTGGGKLPRDQVGQRMGILGYGSIGRQVGRLAIALGMTLLAFTASPKETRESRRDTGFIVPGTGDAAGEYPSEWYSGLDKGSLNHFLSQDIDWLVITVPLTPQTKEILSMPEFQTLSKGGTRPVFISNVSRGTIINQSDLIAALKDGTIAGAALDVTDPEPLPESSDLWEMPNVTITPHTSSVVDKYSDRSFEVLELNLERVMDGRPLINEVKRDRGY